MRNKSQATATMVRLLESARYEVLPTASIEEVVLEHVGTDLELTIRVRIPADTEGEGSAVVPARLFSEIVRQLDGDTVSVDMEPADAFGD